MKTRDSLNAAEALVLTMVLVSAADGGITDREIGVMSGQVQTLPVFQDFTTDQLVDVTDAAVGLLRDTDGLDHAARLIRAALPQNLRETAYALACEIIAGDRGRKEASLRMLEFVRDELGLDPLVTAAIERTVRARHQRLPQSD
ncbi:MAG: tellurite resistance TerB family protein [Acetobacteraceae bacterium]|nr:tellurite resistance TerB family protein [Pseudomonadota bacterium]